MSLPEPRKGEELGFYIFSGHEEISTIGDPERVVWSSIKQLGAQEIAITVLEDRHKIKNKSKREKIAKNIKLYISHAFEFYEAARSAKPNTAPLFYYYAFMNLAKALCEIKHPLFHREHQCYRHGIGWRPNKKYLVNLETEFVTLNTKGVWHVLWEAVNGGDCKADNPTKLQVRELFAMCPEISSDFYRSFSIKDRLIELVAPQIIGALDKSTVWVRFSVKRDSLKYLSISRNKLLEIISYGDRQFHQIKSKENSCWAFELKNPITFSSDSVHGGNEDIFSIIQNMNLFVSFDNNQNLSYAVPNQTLLPIRMPQILVLYTLMFWLGSLVRYDPHSLADLQDSAYWIVIDAFMNDSRLWLLELFEWQFYKFETKLTFAR